MNRMGGKTVSESSMLSVAELERTETVRNDWPESTLTVLSKTAGRYIEPVGLIGVL